MIRPATSADAEAIAAMHVRAWSAGFREFIDAGLLPDAVLEERIGFWHRCLGRPAGEIHVLVADHPERGILGVCLILPTSEDADLGDPGIAQIPVLYVDPSAWRAGLGRSLLAEGRRWLRRKGRHSWVLWTLADHGATLAFYTAEGFRPDGAERPPDATFPRLIRLRAPVGDATNP